MKKVITLSVILGMAASTFAAEIGKPAPDFTGTDINGKTVKFSDYKGKIIVVESYNSDCPFCKKHYQGATQELQKELAAKDVVWLLVNSAPLKSSHYRTPEQAQKEWADLKIAATTWIDDSSGYIANLYDMKTTLHCFVVGKDGTLVYDGAMDDKPDTFHDPKTARNYVKEAVNDLLAGKPVEVSKTKPYGCSVKYTSW